MRYFNISYWNQFLFRLSHFKGLGKTILLASSTQQHGSDRSMQPLYRGNDDSTTIKESGLSSWLAIIVKIKLTECSLVKSLTISLQSFNDTSTSGYTENLLKTSTSQTVTLKSDLFLPWEQIWKQKLKPSGLQPFEDSLARFSVTSQQHVSLSQLQNAYNLCMVKSDFSASNGRPVITPASALSTKPSSVPSIFG